jgi:predicted transglutaminase-like cysteine proteinase
VSAHAKDTLSRRAAASMMLLVLLACPSAGAARSLPLNISVGEPAPPPDGWIQFCADYSSECKTPPSNPREIALSPQAWKELVRINGWVNTHIKPMSDMAHWGVIDRWNYPDDGYGDCEDYVLLKRRMLMQAGWPREALLITLVRDHDGDGHAVLTVKTDKGEFILDNQRDSILLWSETGYEFLSRQSQSDPNLWVSLLEPSASPAVVAALDRTGFGEPDDIHGEDQSVVSLTSVAQNSGMASKDDLVVTIPDGGQSLGTVNAVDQLSADHAPENPPPSGVQPGWGVQLIGNSSETSALASYRQLQKAYNSLLGSRQPLVIRTKVGTDSYWYRVRVAAATRGAAETLCGDLRAVGGNCLVQRD